MFVQEINYREKDQFFNCTNNVQLKLSKRSIPTYSLSPEDINNTGRLYNLMLPFEGIVQKAAGFGLSVTMMCVNFQQVLILLSAFRTYTNSIKRGSPAAIILMSFMKSCSLETFHG